MAHHNEISSNEKLWYDSNFSAYTNNIFEAFKEQEFELTETIYTNLCNNNDYHIRIYMGLDDEDNPKLIAMAADEQSAHQHDEIVYNDIFAAGNIYELGANTGIDINDAEDFIANWMNSNTGKELYKRAFLLLRTNLDFLFDDENVNSIKLDFGIEKTVKVMLADASYSAGDPILNRNKPCPDICSDIY